MRYETSLLVELNTKLDALYFRRALNIELYASNSIDIDLEIERLELQVVNLRKDINRYETQ